MRYSSPMRVTFDSNVWQKVVKPSLTRKTSLYDAFTTVHEALRTKKIQGFICETVGTLEAVRLAGRKAYFTSIKPIVEVKCDAQGGQVHLTINIGTNHDQHAGLPNVLSERLQLAFALGMRLMRAPRIGLPVPDSFLSSSVFADEVNVSTSAARDNRWGDVVKTIEQRGVGSAFLHSLRAQTARNPETTEDKEFARAVAEWSDGDSVAAHVAYSNDVFCTEDQGKGAIGGSILDADNRMWLSATYNVKFATITELTTQIHSKVARS
jgi:hypothetical protein